MTSTDPELELGLVPSPPSPPPLPEERSVDEVVREIEKIEDLMRRAMRDGEHFGVIPGTGGKPTLLQPGAQKLSVLYQLRPEFELVEQLRDGDHYTATVRATLIHIPTGRVRGTQIASCSTRESRYAWRQAKRQCPACGAPAIIKGRAEWGGGWVCHKKQGGCGAKFSDRDAMIVNQPVGRVPNPDLVDTHNTVLKMAQKRAFVGAMLTATAASDVFTQDLEDAPEPPVPAPPPNGAPAPPEAVEATEVTRVPERELLDIAEFSEWLVTLQHVRTVKAAQEVWKQLQAPDVWVRFTATEQAELVKAKDAAKARITKAEVA
jgi:hypothetical protein